LLLAISSVTDGSANGTSCVCCVRQSISSAPVAVAQHRISWSMIPQGHLR
jgi:hypothetical protein